MARPPSRRNGRIDLPFQRFGRCRARAEVMPTNVFNNLRVKSAQKPQLILKGFSAQCQKTGGLRRLWWRGRKLGVAAKRATFSPQRASPAKGYSRRKALRLRYGGERLLQLRTQGAGRTARIADGERRGGFVPPSFPQAPRPRLVVTRALWSFWRDCALPTVLHPRARPGSVSPSALAGPFRAGCSQRRRAHVDGRGSPAAPRRA
jgi:hypothetical protein